jgi:hypothetical protein
MKGECLFGSLLTARKVSPTPQSDEVRSLCGLLNGLVESYVKKYDRSSLFCDLA